MAIVRGGAPRPGGTRRAMARPVALLPIRKKKVTERPRFDDGRNPELLDALLSTARSVRHVIVVQLGSCLELRWPAPEPGELPPGTPVAALAVPRHLSRDLPPSWVVASVERELAGTEIRTIIRIAPALAHVA